MPTFVTTPVVYVSFYYLSCTNMPSCAADGATRAERYAVVWRADGVVLIDEHVLSVRQEEVVPSSRLSPNVCSCVDSTRVY